MFDAVIPIVSVPLRLAACFPAAPLAEAATAMPESARSARMRTAVRGLTACLQCGWWGRSDRSEELGRLRVEARDAVLVAGRGERRALVGAGVERHRAARAERAAGGRVRRARRVA